MTFALVAASAGIVSIIFAILLAAYTLRKDAGNARMREIAAAIVEGSNAYLKRQYRTIGLFAIIIAILLYFALGAVVAGTFIAGAFLSALSGYIGMAISIRANSRVAASAELGLKNALALAFRGGAVNGFGIVGLGLLGVAVLFMMLGDPALIIGFAFGASLVSLFARIGGGIYTKAADVGADLVGKLEKGIPEDDPRNPAVIADNVGDNVGDCAGMGADMFESYVVTLIAAMLLGSMLFGVTSVQTLLPITLAAVAIIASMIGSVFVRASNEKGIWRGMQLSLIVSAILSAIGFYFVASSLVADWSGIWIAGVAGLVTAVLIAVVIDHYTKREGAPVRAIAEASRTGPATNIIIGMSVGLRSTLWPVLIVAAAILISFAAAGLFGIAIASLGLLAMTGLIMSIDSYGPIADNAGGIAEMANMPARTRKITDALDAVGNTTKATTKGIAVASAALSALALFAAYLQEVGLSSLNIMQVDVLIGLLIGAAIPFFFASYAMSAVGKTAGVVVEEVRRQFREIKGLMTGKAKPDYARCVDICTRGALRQLAAPGLIAVLSPIIIGFVLGPAALGGAIAGAIASGFLLALFLSTTGGAWDNAKKYIEAGNLGGKGSDAHKAAVVGDTVGDPCKDTAGPSINPLIKVMNTLAIVLASLFVAWHLVAV